MTDINHYIGTGHLTRDAELKYIGTNGTALLKFSIASNRSIKQGDGWTEEASFFDVELWGKLAEALAPYMLKGKPVTIAGELRQQRWEQDGQNRSKLVIIANEIKMGGGGQGQAPAQGQGQAAKPAPGAQAGNQDAYTDDIPF